MVQRTALAPTITTSAAASAASATSAATSAAIRLSADTAAGRIITTSDNGTDS